MFRKSIIAAALLGLGMSAAQAQYYAPPGRPYAPPPPGYPRPPGFRCEATLPTRGGPRQIICPMREPRPVGAPCHCPPLPPPPGYPWGPPLRGYMIP
ncbi:MAG: hypothetical protein WDN49_02040 [Acetobacteraceae bacterium]